MDTEVLKELGLNEIEIKFYIELLKSGSLLASEISSKLNLHRTTSYYVLENLIKKGLASYVIKSGKKYFFATSPEKLYQLGEERKMKLNSLIPELLNLNVENEKGIKVEVYEGKEGIKSIWEDILKSCKENDELCITATGKAPKILPYYLPNFHTRRIKQKIHLKIIYNNISESVSRGNELKKLKFVNVKFLSNDYSMPTSNLIYSNKVAFMFWNENKVTGILIEDESIRKSFKSYFDILWKVSLPSYSLN